MALLQGAAPGTDIVLTEERMESSRAFANKIWNAARFLFMNQEGQASGLSSPEGALPIEDRWIFSRLNATAEAANRAIGQYRYHEYAQLLWHFFWHEFCDWYLELKKVPGATWSNATRAFETALRLLHPAMPFLTEELWQRLGNAAPISIALAPYPQFRSELADPEAESQIEILKKIVGGARLTRAENKLDPRQQLTGTLYCADLDLAQRQAEAIQKLAHVKLELKAEAGTEWRLVLDVPKSQEDAQHKRLEKEREQLEKNIANSKRQLSDDVFLSKAPAKVVESIRGKLADYEAQLAKMT
jgi:valyl-tRNA synthetase